MVRNTCAAGAVASAFCRTRPPCQSVRSAAPTGGSTLGAGLRPTVGSTGVTGMVSQSERKSRWKGTAQLGGSMERAALASTARSSRGSGEPTQASPPQQQACWIAVHVGGCGWLPTCQDGADEGANDHHPEAACNRRVGPQRRSWGAAGVGGLLDATQLRCNKPLRRQKLALSRQATHQSRCRTRWRGPTRGRG